jgi:hypothetical protein
VRRNAAGFSARAIASSRADRSLLTIKCFEIEQRRSDDSVVPAPRCLTEKGKRYCPFRPPTVRIKILTFFPLNLYLLSLLTSDKDSAITLLYSETQLLSFLSVVFLGPQLCPFNLATRLTPTPSNP